MDFNRAGECATEIVAAQALNACLEMEPEPGSKFLASLLRIRTNPTVAYLGSTTSSKSGCQRELLDLPRLDDGSDTPIWLSQYQEWLTFVENWKLPRRMLI
jgi:hypothetical protein